MNITKEKIGIAREKKIQLIFMALVLFTPILDVPLGYAQYAVLKLFDMLTAIGGFLPQVL